MAAEIERPKDVCECGDWRSDHPDNGPCRHNAPGFDVCHANSDCTAFRLSQSATPSIESEIAVLEQGRVG